MGSGPFFFERLLYKKNIHIFLSYCYSFSLAFMYLGTLNIGGILHIFETFYMFRELNRKEGVFSCSMFLFVYRCLPTAFFFYSAVVFYRQNICSEEEKKTNITRTGKEIRNIKVFILWFPFILRILLQKPFNS